MEQKFNLILRRPLKSWKIEQNEFMKNQMTMQLILENLAVEKRRRMIFEDFLVI